MTYLYSALGCSSKFDFSAFIIGLIRHLGSTSAPTEKGNSNKKSLNGMSGLDILEYIVEASYKNMKAI